MNAQLIPPVPIDVSILPKPVPKRDWWPTPPSWLNGDATGLMLWKRTFSAADGESFRQPSQAEIENFPRIVECLREISALEARSFIVDEYQRFADALRVLEIDGEMRRLATVGPQHLLRGIPTRQRVYESRHRKVTESMEEYWVRTAFYREACRRAGIRVVWAEGPE